MIVTQGNGIHSRVLVASYCATMAGQGPDLSLRQRLATLRSWGL